MWREGKSAAECGCGVDSELPGARTCHACSGSRPGSSPSVPRDGPCEGVASGVAAAEATAGRRDAVAGGAAGGTTGGALGGEKSIAPAQKESSAASVTPPSRSRPAHALRHPGIAEPRPSALVGRAGSGGSWWGRRFI